MTVRQDQPIINLPDPLHMRVKARINESKLSLVHTGQSAANRRRRLSRTAAQGPRRRSHGDQYTLERIDVRVYYANVDIAQGFADLRPGLSAEVAFLVDSRRNVTRVPLDVDPLGPRTRLRRPLRPFLDANRKAKMAMEGGPSRHQRLAIR